MRAWLRRKNPASCGGAWLGRMLRGLRPDRNPLRRGSDRAETAIIGVLLAAFLAAAPFAAHAAGNWTYATSAREAHAQQALIHEVRATLLQAATPPDISEGGSEANARWKAPDGQVRSGQIFVPANAQAGGTVVVWVNRAGQLTGSPLQHSQVTGRANLARGFAIAGLAVTLIVVGLACRWVLNRRRLAAWDTDWLATEPRWSSRR
jgi:hypothetical protein